MSGGLRIEPRKLLSTDIVIRGFQDYGELQLIPIANLSFRVIGPEIEFLCTPHWPGFWSAVFKQEPARFVIEGNGHALIGHSHGFLSAYTFRSDSGDVYTHWFHKRDIIINNSEVLKFDRFGHKYIGPAREFTLPELMMFTFAHYHWKD